MYVQPGPLIDRDKTFWDFRVKPPTTDFYPVSSYMELKKKKIVLTKQIFHCKFTHWQGNLSEPKTTMFLNTNPEAGSAEFPNREFKVTQPS